MIEHINNVFATSRSVSSLWFRRFSFLHFLSVKQIVSFCSFGYLCMRAHVRMCIRFVHDSSL